MTDTKTLAERLRVIGRRNADYLDRQELATIAKAADALDRITPPDAGVGLTLETTAEERAIRAERADYDSVHGNTFMARLVRDHDTLTATLAERDRRIAALDAAYADLQKANVALFCKNAVLAPATDKGGE